MLRPGKSGIDAFSSHRRSSVGSLYFTQLIRLSACFMLSGDGIRAGDQQPLSFLLHTKLWFCSGIR